LLFVVKEERSASLAAPSSDSLRAEEFAAIRFGGPLARVA
jgi:hypothetical protein